MAAQPCESGFSSWREGHEASLLTTADTLIDSLEDVAALLTELTDHHSHDVTDAQQQAQDADATDARSDIVQRFLEGVESARSVVSVLKREKWRLSRREMSVELKIGELEDYKSHLKSDMTSLNGTVEVLSMRVVQLENQLAEQQELQESLEAELAEQHKLTGQSQARGEVLKQDMKEMAAELNTLKSHTTDTLLCENKSLKNEIAVLRDENRKLKELIRSAETHPQLSDDDHLSRLTRDFLRELSSLEVEDRLSLNSSQKSSTSSSHEEHGS